MREFAHEVAVKVCGVTNADDALACAAAGVEMIGLNFSPTSARGITAEAAALIIAAVRPQFPRMEFVGVFVNQDLELVRQIESDLQLDAVQLHGEETPAYTRQLHPAVVIKALRVRPDAQMLAAAEYDCAAILLDTWNADSLGGTGQTFPWSVAAALQPRPARLILAGGLTIENVAEAIRTVRPFAVDVCSGVETAPGRKDHALVRRFVAEVRDEKAAIRA